jgi:UMP-CMP kinase
VGKGTQCTRLALEPELKIAHVSVGDLLRKEQASNSTEAELIKHHMLAGTLVPDELSVAILRKFLTAKMGEGFTRFLVDGFPRSARQVDMFETEVCTPGPLEIWTPFPEFVVDLQMQSGFSFPGV